MVIDVFLMGTLALCLLLYFGWHARPGFFWMNFVIIVLVFGAMLGIGLNAWIRGGRHAVELHDDYIILEWPGDNVERVQIGEVIKLVREERWDHTDESPFWMLYWGDSERSLSISGMGSLDADVVAYAVQARYPDIPVMRQIEKISLGRRETVIEPFE